VTLVVYGLVHFSEKNINIFERKEKSLNKVV
jgi:hypothetical protein